MEFSVETKLLFSTLKHMADLIKGAGVSDPTLVQCRMTATINDKQQHSLELFSGFDGAFVTAVLPCNAAKVGTATVNLSHLTGLSAVKGRYTEFTTAKKTFSFVSGKTKGTLPIGFAEELQPLPEISRDVQTEFSAKRLLWALKTAKVDPYEKETVTCSLLCETGKTTIQVYDSYRVAVTRIKTDAILAEPIQIVVSFSMLLNAVQNTKLSDTVSIGSDGTYAFVQSKEFSTVWLLLQAEPYDILGAVKKIERDPSTTLDTTVSQFLDDVESTSVATQAIGAKEALLACTVGNDGLMLSAASNIGEATTECSGQLSDQSVSRVDVSAVQLGKALRCLDGDVGPLRVRMTEQFLLLHVRDETKTSVQYQAIRAQQV